MKFHAVACLAFGCRWEKVREWGNHRGYGFFYDRVMRPLYRFRRSPRFLMVCRRCGSREVWRSEQYLEWSSKRSRRPFYLRAACLLVLFFVSVPVWADEISTHGGSSVNVVIKVIPQAEQRYETTGDWWWEGDSLQLRISDSGDWREDMAIAYHELFEALACKKAGISTESVDKFDMDWKLHDGYEEPGDDPKAPYHFQHQMALSTEQTLRAMLGIESK